MNRKFQLIEQECSDCNGIEWQKNKTRCLLCLGTGKVMAPERTIDEINRAIMERKLYRDEMKKLVIPPEWLEEREYDKE